MRTTIYLFLLFICLSACNRQNAQETIASEEAHHEKIQNIQGAIDSSETYQNVLQSVCDTCLLNKSNSSEIYQEILLRNKKIIPFLIEYIDIEKDGVVAFINPISSDLYSYKYNNKLGINYAYYIDYILSKDSIETVNKDWEEPDDYHWAEITKSYRIYHIGVIVKQDENNKPILEPLTHEDMIKIKKMYSDWWEQNKDKSIETLRKEFRKGNKILKLPYVWI